jgi:two-component system sensor histidine kinase KdpD
VGKTYAMLSEGRRRLERGTDVAVGLVETHGRLHTREMTEGLEIIPRQELRYRGGVFTEMDVDAVLARHPSVALVDELAHTNVPGARNAKRWQDVEELLEAGIDVISTVNIQHLESVNDVVAKITGIPQRETLPDSVVRAAEQVELVDMAPEALRRRMAHGNVYTAEKIDAALSNYFRVGNLTALRELALLWTADKVDEALQTYRAQHEIEGTWEARERVVVALTGGPEGETLVRRAARIAARSTGGELMAVHVTPSDGLTGASPAALADQRRLVESLGGTYHQVLGEDIPEALLTFARAENATQLVLGTSRRTWLGSLFTGPGIGASTIRDSGDIDVHIVTHSESGRGTKLPRLRGSISRRRRLQGFALALLVPPLLTLLLVPQHETLNLVTDVLLFLLVVVVVALVGGFFPALLAAVGGSILLNFFFTPPYYTFTIYETNNTIALVVFIAVALMVSSVVDLLSRRTRQAARAAAEAETLSTLAGEALRGRGALPDLLERLRTTFSLTAVTLLERAPDETGGGSMAVGPTTEWRVLAHAGAAACERPEAADSAVPFGERLVLAINGRALRAEDQRLLGAFAAQAAAALERQRLSEAAAEARPLAEANKMRTALLAAVGHDLRTPLATVKAYVTSLLSRDVVWSEEEREQLLHGADDALDRLAALVDNLLDMSRLQAGAMDALIRPTMVDEVAARALDDIGAEGKRFVVDVPDGVPPVLADPGLLERVVVNLLANAARYSPPERKPLLTASSLGEKVELRIVDRGPGIPPAALDQVFEPFQRLGDTDNTTGVGLGLALARGLTELMGGTLTPEETPGGGLTMVVALQAAPRCPADVGPQPGRRERGTDFASTEVDP